MQELGAAGPSTLISAAQRIGEKRARKPNWGGILPFHILRVKRLFNYALGGFWGVSLPEQALTLIDLRSALGGGVLSVMAIYQQLRSAARRSSTSGRKRRESSLKGARWSGRASRASVYFWTLTAVCIAAKCLAALLTLL